MDFSDSPMTFGASSFIVSGPLRIKKVDSNLLLLFSKKKFDFWWSGIALPPCALDQKVAKIPKTMKNNENTMLPEWIITLIIVSF